MSFEAQLLFTISGPEPYPSLRNRLEAARSGLLVSELVLSFAVLAMLWLRARIISSVRADSSACTDVGGGVEFD